MNKADKERQEKFLEIYHTALREVMVRSTGQMEKEVSIEIDEMANCILAAAFATISMEYVRMEYVKDKEYIEVIEDLIQHNFKQFKENIPKHRKSWRKYKQKDEVLK